MTTYKMMDEVVCFCTKCNMNLNHRITRVEDGQPKRVLCLTCKTDRNYRRVVSSKTPRASSGSSPAKKPRAASARAQQEADWKSNLTRGLQTPKKYSMETVFAKDDHVQHPTFGRGLVIDLIPPDKVNIFFEEEGVKTLKCGVF